MDIPIDKNVIQPGMVVLVGAGPGDPDLLTIAAVKALQAADVVVYDALVSDEILAFIPASCETIFAGKRGGRPSTSQSDIYQTLVQHARAGKRVVRLKGGDPFVFGRGGEEAARLVKDGIPFRIVPGLTVGIAGPAYAGIPITHRSVNANVTFITGHESAENAPFCTGQGSDETDLSSSRIDWEALGKTAPVLVLYMAMSNLPMVTQRLIAAGRSPETPVAIIRWATTPQQQTLITTLAQAVADVQYHQLQPPAIIVVGDVVNFRQELAWFPDVTLSSRHPS